MLDVQPSVQRWTARHDGLADGPEKASEAEIAASSLQPRGLRVAIRNLAEHRAGELGYLCYSQLFVLRPR